MAVATASPATEATYTVKAAAWELGVSKGTVWRLCLLWYGEIGSGRRHELTAVDLMVARAWVALTNGERGHNTECRRLYEMAERAIRRQPKPWLLLLTDSARTFDTAQAAAAEWLRLTKTGAHVARLICVEVQS